MNERSLMESFRIRGFKKFKDIEFDNLGRINLFLGNNNTGKTTILEAVQIYAYGENFLSAIQKTILRNMMIMNKFDLTEKLLSIFYNQHEKPFRFSFKAETASNNRYNFEYIFNPGSILADFNPILMGQFGDNESKCESEENDTTFIGGWRVNSNLPKQLQLIGTDKDSFPIELNYPLYKSVQSNNKDTFILSRFVDIMSHRNQKENLKIFSFLKRQGLLDSFLKELSKNFTHLKEIDTIPYPDGSISAVNIRIKDGKLLPLYRFGDGMRRWYNILGGMIVYQNAIHCIEEIDSTFHPNAQPELVKNIIYYAKKYYNQIFMTSHSLEFVDEFLEVLYGPDGNLEDDCVRVITLRNDEKTGTVQKRVLTGREAYEAREKYKLELR